MNQKKSDETKPNIYIYPRQQFFFIPRCLYIGFADN